MLEDLRIQQVMLGGLVFLIAGFLGVPGCPALRLRDAEAWPTLRFATSTSAGSTTSAARAASSAATSFPPSVQWIDRDSYFFPLQEMLRWGMGPAFGLAGWLAWPTRPTGSCASTTCATAAPVLFVLVYFGFMGRQFSLYLRYFLPLYPVLAVLAGFALADLLRWAPQRSLRRRRQPQIARTRRLRRRWRSCWPRHCSSALAYSSIYTRPVTRVEASRWLYENLPAGSRIAGEHWDDTVPMRLPGSPDKQLATGRAGLYELDTPEKVTKLIDSLDRADYVVISSNRLLNSIPRNPLNYPVTSRYYELLLDERAGLPAAARVHVLPGAPGHRAAGPRRRGVLDLLRPPAACSSSRRRRTTRAPTSRALLGHGPFATASLTPAQADQQRPAAHRPTTSRRSAKAAPGRTSSATAASCASYPTLLWLLRRAGGGAGRDAARAGRCSARLPDRGYLLVEAAGALLLAYPVWLLVSLKLVHFSRTTILGVLAACSSSVGGAFARVAARGLAGVRARATGASSCSREALFLVAFLFFRELRLENPDLWHPFRGGEKPMDFAYLTAVTRSTTLPPYDPWFAGGYINYYYLGQFFTATLIKLTASRPR